MRTALKFINLIHIIIGVLLTFVFLGLLIASLIGNGPIVEDIWQIMRPHHVNEAGQIINDFANWTPIPIFRETTNIGTAEAPIWTFATKELWQACDANVEKIIIGLRIQFIVFNCFSILLCIGSYLCLKRMNDATRKTQFILPIILMFLSFNWVTPIMIICCRRKTLINQNPYFE